MSQRDSGYERKERDLYETPEWVTDALLPYIPARVSMVWEPACASGKMSRALIGPERGVIATDIFDDQPLDFLSAQDLIEPHIDAIVTNPPYALATEFIRHALKLTSEVDGFVAMLLRTDFDHATSRADLFDRNQFSRKVVLRKRIRWFEDSKGSPSFNHAWYCWDWRHVGYPEIAYAH